MTRRLATGETSLAYYLLYWWLDGGLLVNVDGSMSLSWRVECLDPSCLPSADINAKASILRRMLNQLPAGYHVQWLRRARRVDDRFFDEYRKAQRTADPLFVEQRAMSAEALRARGLRQFETYFILTKPNALGKLGSRGSGAASRLYNRILGRQDPLTLTLAQHEAAKRELEATAQNAVQALSSTGVRLEPLDGQGFLRLIYSFVNPSATQENTPLLEDLLPREVSDAAAIYRDLSLREQVLRTSLSWDLDMLSLDDPLRPHRVLAMKELPRRSIRADLTMGLAKIEYEHWLAVGITAVDTSRREGKMERRRNAAFASARGRYTRNAKAEAEYHDLEAALDQMAKRDQRLFELSFHVLLGADELVHLDEITRTTVQSVSSATRIHLQTATYAQLHGWLGMMPGAGHNTPHKRVVFTDNAADFVPIYSSAPGAGRPLFVLSHRSGEPFFLDIANPRKTNWNMNIFGSSGRGKSFFTAAAIASSIVGQGSPLVVIDVGGRDEHGNIVGSYHRLCELAGGEYFEFSLDGANAMNPFVPRAELYASDTGDPAPQPNKLKLRFLTGIVEMLVRGESEPPLSPVQEGILQAAIARAYDRCGATRIPVLADLIPELQHIGLDREDTTVARGYAKTLQAWVSGPYGALINTPSRIRPKTAFTVFDMKGLENLGRLAPVVMMTISSCVWSMIARRRDGLAWVIYDECWKLLNDPTAAKLQEELYRTARKLNAGVISVTQRIEDFLKAPGAQAIVDNAEGTFLLGNNKHRETVARLVGLNAREFELFKSLELRKGFYSEVLFKPDEDSVDVPALVRYHAGPLDYWINTTDPLDRELEREVLRSAGGDRSAALRRLATEFPNGAVAGKYRRKEVA